MKKTLKKSLTVIAVIAAVMLMMTFAASAVNDCGNGNHSIATRTYDATCTTAGYIESYCTICGNTLGTTVTEAPLGHDYAGVSYQYDYVEADDYYKRGLTCQRAECGETQYDSHLEGQTSVFDRYYLIELVNPWIADTYCADVTYTKVVETYKESLVATKKNAEYGNWYIKEGETIESYVKALGYADYAAWMKAVDNENFVQRAKDKNFGLYVLEGWATEVVDADAIENTALVDFANTTVTGNCKLYAAFSGDPDVFYSVQYMNANGAYFTVLFDVRHGTAADDSIFEPEYDGEGNFLGYKNNKLTLPEDSKYYYEYKGWNYDREHIYGNVTIAATYTSVPKEYEFILYEWDESKGDFTDSGFTAKGIYGGALQYADADGNAVSASAIKALTEREKDRSYIYSWTGNWQTADGGYNVSSSNITLPYGTLDSRYSGEEGYSPLVLIPSYDRRYTSYETTVTIKFDRNVNFSGTGKDYETKTYLNGLNVQITDANGQLMATGTANLVEGTDYAEFKCSLYDSKSYTVTVTSYRGKYSGVTTLSRTYVYDTNLPVYISVGLTLDEGYTEGRTCHCICHSTLFRPIWVRILNLLYRIFNVKYVCCDDMYASIGDLLAYTK